MGGELVREPSHQNPPALSFSAIMDDWFPLYLSWGMSVEEYWNKDPWLAKAFREAQELREKRENLLAHRQGRYFYDADCAANAPLYAFLGAKPLPYVEPYPVTEEDVQKLYERRAREAADKFSAWSLQYNKERGD